MTWKKISSKRFSLRLAENWVYAPAQFEKFYGVTFPNQVIIIKNGMELGFLNQEQLDAMLEKVLEKIYSCSFETFYEKKAVPLIDSFLAFCKNIAEKDLAGMSNKELTSLLQKYQEKEDEWMNVVWMAFILDDILTPTLTHELKKLGKTDLLLDIVTPTKETAMMALKRELREYLGEGDVKKCAQNLAKKYSYFSILNMDERPLKKNYFEEELKKTKEDMQTISSEKYEKAKAQFSDSRMVRLIEACNKIAFYREHRNDMRQQSYFYARHLFIQIGNRLGLEIGDVIFITREEMRKSLGSVCKVTKEEIQKRKQASMIACIDEKISYSFDQKKITAFLKEHSPTISLTKLKGVVAYPGKIQGSVKIIQNIKEDAQKIQEGDILVTTTTNLGFVEVLGKAAGIITDEGGTLCHAAIVARELKKPCIVGTQHATDSLKDGEVVELDADKGIVVKVCQNLETTPSQTD